MAIKEVFGLFGSSIIAVIFLSLLLVIVVILLNIEKKLSKKLQVKDIDIERKTQLVRGIENIPNLDNRPERLIVYVDSYARRLFSEYLIPGKKIEYSQLSEYFTQQKQDDLAAFCSEMTSTFYSGDEPSIQSIMKVVTDLKKIAEKYLLGGPITSQNTLPAKEKPLKAPQQIKPQTLPSPSATQTQPQVVNQTSNGEIEMNNETMDKIRKRLLEKIQQEKLQANSPQLQKKSLEQSKEEKEEEAKLVEYKPKALPAEIKPSLPRTLPKTRVPPQKTIEKPKPKPVERPEPKAYQTPKRYSGNNKEITIEDIDEIENLKAKIESMTQSRKRKN